VIVIVIVIVIVRGIGTAGRSIPLTITGMSGRPAAVPPA
jgi:hypothetical protein